ncbi:MAG: hypothetical protein M3O31_07960 [Acidobacteriota bacterium]|nr:hypothetical protein [Acidobacteriota bacterium]
MSESEAINLNQRLEGISLGSGLDALVVWQALQHENAILVIIGATLVWMLL